MNSAIRQESILEVGQQNYCYASIENEVDTIVFAIEKLHNKHPAAFEKLVEYLKLKGKRSNTKKIQQ